MRITWYGHAAFLVETEGTRIILDPFRSPDSGGYLPIDDSADIVAVSHENDRYHSHLGQIRPPFEVVRGLELPPEGQTVRGICFKAIHVFETPERLAEDEVTILHFAEGLHVVHLGDLGHRLEDIDLAPLRGRRRRSDPRRRPADDRLGTRPGIAQGDRPENRRADPLQKPPKIDLNILPLERFLEVVSDWPIVREGSSSFDVSRATLPERPTIVVLEHAR